MTIKRTFAVVLGTVVLVCGATVNAQAGIRGRLAVYNQSANPYHLFVEGQRIGTITRGQTLNVNVNDWNGPTELVAIQAGSQGRIRFVQQVRTCRVARWELHTHWEQLKTFGGPRHAGPMHGGPMHGGPMHGGPMHGGPMHGGPVQWGPHHGNRHHGGQAAIGYGVGMIVRGANQHNPHRGADIANGILAIIAGATRH